MMRTLVDHYKQRMIEKCTYAIGHQKNQPQGRIFHQIRDSDHSAYQTNNGENGKWVSAHELLYFGILLKNLKRADAVRLWFGRKMKIGC